MLQPFFVSEEIGALQTRIESLFTQRRDGRTVAQPFSIYRYPKFVQQPQFDLSFFYVQNKFWGRYRETDNFDTATPGEVHFHLSREKSFLGDYEFNVLDLETFSPDGRQIIEFQPAETSPVITLRRDVPKLDQPSPRYPGSISGPIDNRNAEYANVIFSLEAGKKLVPSDEVYLVGDFNEWMMDSRYRMRYNSTRQLWQTKALIKQGTYAYKYVVLQDESINDLGLDRGFTDHQQSYMTFVYFRDPDRQFDRLLKVDYLSK